MEEATQGKNGIGRDFVCFHSSYIVGKIHDHEPHDVTMATKEIVVEILTKDKCCLCEYAKEVLEVVLPDYNAKLNEINIEKEDKLMALYGEKIPVIRVDGEEWFIYKVSEPVLRKRLEDYIKGN